MDIFFFNSLQDLKKEQEQFFWSSGPAVKQVASAPWGPKHLWQGIHPSSRQGHAPLHMCKVGGMRLILRKEAWPLLIWELGVAAGSSRDPVFGCQSPIPLSFQPDFHFRQGLCWTEANNIWISWYWHPCRKAEDCKKNPQNGFTPENDCPSFASHSLTLMSFVLKLPKTANEKDVLRENNVVQFPEEFCLQSMVQSRILPGCRAMRQADEVQLVTCCEKNTWVCQCSMPALLWCIIQRKNWMSLKSEDKELWWNLMVQSATAWTWRLKAGISAISCNSSAGSKKTEKYFLD